MLGSLLLTSAAANADYTPTWNYTIGVGSSGGLVQNQGTNLDASDTVNAWNAWTGTSKLSVGSTGCGTTASCIIFANDGAYLTYTNCMAPEVPSGIWAQTYVMAGYSYYNMTCDDGSVKGSTSHPVFAVSYNNELGLGSTARLHLQRHEAGHGLLLGDADVQCWGENWFWYPLMNNSIEASCSGYPSNYTATANEAAAVVSRNGW